MSRRRDEVRVERVGAGGFDRFTSLEITNDLTGPSEGAFELGDDGTWREIGTFVDPGSQYKVFVNGRLRLTGRVEANDIPTDAASGSVVRFVVRTKLADAMYASADPKVRVTKTSIKQFLLDIFKPLGYAEADFVFQQDVSRDLMTGVRKGGGKAPVDLEKLEEEQAKVNPPESIHSCADRHLRRHGLMLWDSPDGKIVVGTPNQDQNPLYYFRMMLGLQGAENNLLAATRIKDWSDLASRIGVYGVGGKSDHTKSKVRAISDDDDVVKAGFYRPVLIISEGIKTQALAERAVKRERSARSKQKDAWELVFDGLSWWSGSESIPFGVDTMCDIVSSVAGGPAGAYYIHRTTLRRSAGEADTTTISCLRKGIWSL